MLLPYVLSIYFYPKSIAYPQFLSSNLLFSF